MSHRVSSPFVRKLRREIKANPAKAAILAVLFVVAIWFWIPLVEKWCGATPAAGTVANASAPQAAGAEGTAANGTATAAGSGAPTTTTSPPTAIPVNATEANAALEAIKNKPAAYPWQVVVRRLEKDPRMTPVVDLGNWRDPFGPSAVEVAAAAEKKEAEKKLAAKKKTKAAQLEELTPAGAGLTLASTIIRPERSLALINGQVYYEGNFVPANDDNGGFIVTDIRPRQIVLERHGKRYQLDLKSVEIARKSASGNLRAKSAEESFSKAAVHD
jgi:hypothetical protein